MNDKIFTDNQVAEIIPLHTFIYGDMDTSYIKCNLCDCMHQNNSLCQMSFDDYMEVI